MCEKCIVSVLNLVVCIATTRLWKTNDIYLHILQQLHALSHELRHTCSSDLTAGVCPEISDRNFPVNQTVSLKSNSQNGQLFFSYTKFKLLVSAVKVKWFTVRYTVNSWAFFTTRNSNALREHLISHLCSSWITGVSGQPIGPIFNGQAVQEDLDCMTLVRQDPIGCPET
jgi:hypothetical protein